MVFGEDEAGAVETLLADCWEKGEEGRFKGKVSDTFLIFLHCEHISEDNAGKRMECGAAFGGEEKEGEDFGFFDGVERR